MEKCTFFITLICLISFTVISCSKDDFEGSETLIIIDRELPSFNRISVENDLEINVVQGSSQMVRITVNQNLQNQIKTTVSNNTLNVSLEDGSYDNAHFVLNVEVSDLERLELNDNTRGDVNFTSNQLEIEVNGSSSLQLGGNSNVLNAEINDAGKITGFAFTAEVLNTTSRDASELEITCINQLNGTVRQSSKVLYRGNPVINAQTSENGQIVDSN